MRARLALSIWTVVLVGCQAIEPQIETDVEARLPESRFVTLQRLAADLHLHFHGEHDGFLELSAAPDHVMLVEESARALVNGEAVAMGHPCVRRGDQYVVTIDDASTLRAAVTQRRGERQRARREPTPARTPDAVYAPPLPAELRPDVSARPWRYIVIHHQAAAMGSAALIHRAHLKRGMDGLGYHFVIGNGTVTHDGEIEVGYRWRKQIHGAHARVRPGDANLWNNFGIGICLVGDFRYTAPSSSQMAALVGLVRQLRRTYGIPCTRIVPHDFVKPTICPGPKFPWNEFHRRIGCQ